MMTYNSQQSHRPWNIASFIVLAILAFTLFAGPAAAQSSGTPMVVSTFDDVLDGSDGECSLREAVIAANRGRPSGSAGGECQPDSSGMQTILLPAGLYELTRSSRWLEASAITGDLDIYSDLTIQGEGLVVVHAAYDNDRVFEITRNGQVFLSGLTISGGKTNTFGGGIYNKGSLQLENVTLTGNEARFLGGGLHSSRDAQLNNVTVTSNEARFGSGLSRSFGKLNVINSLIVDDSCAGDIDARSGADINLQWQAPGCDAGVFGLNADPGLSAQQAYGVNAIFAIDVSSPAANAADTGLCPAVDQRGMARPQGAACDIGAFEAEEATATAPVARADEYVVTEDVKFSLAAPGVLGNDSLGGAASITAELVTPPPAGSLLDLRLDGSFDFTPPPQFVGEASFEYQARAGSGEASNSTTVTFDIQEDGFIEVVNNCDSGEGSLRRALQQASLQLQAPRTILFDILEDCNDADNIPRNTIPLDSALPAIDVPMKIDGLQFDRGADRTEAVVTLDGQGGAFSGLEIESTGSGSVIRGLIMTNFGGSGAVIGRDGPSDGNRFEQNRITNNGGGNVTTPDPDAIPLNDGITVLDGVNNVFLGNSFAGNADLEIDLGGDGQTPNDPGDGDGGPNLQQNYPILLTATPAGEISGILNSVPETNYTLQLYGSTSCSSEDMTLLTTTVDPAPLQTNESGNVQFTAQAGPLTEGLAIRSTATDPNGNTSEISECIRVTDDNDVWPRAKLISSGAVLQQYLDKLGQHRWYKFIVAPNSTVTFDLTNLPANYDLTMYKDIASAYAELIGTAEPDLDIIGAEQSSDAFAPSAFAPSAFAPSAFAPSAFAPSAFAPSAFAPSAFAPSAFAPSAFAPSAFAPSAFAPSAFAPSAFAPSAFAGNAYSNAQTASLIGVSAFEGQSPEKLVLKTFNNYGVYYARVAGRQGAFDNEAPFTVGLTIEGAACNGLEFDLDMLGTTSLTATDGDFQTLILVDQGRLGGQYPAQLGPLNSKMTQLAAATNGVVVDVGADALVIAANQQADQNPSCPFAKNLVADSIKEIITAYRAANKDSSGKETIKYLVMVGNDDVIPFYREPDLANLGPEEDYEPPVDPLTASEAALRFNFYLSQDRYGSVTELSFKDDSIPLPGLAAGRLVESPAEMITVIDAFLASQVVVPANGLVTGYDFLTDAATAIGDVMDGSEGGSTGINVNDSLVSETWTAFDLDNVIDNNDVEIAYLAGHFSANAALAADYQTFYLPTDLLGSPQDLSNAVFVGNGCHAAYNIVNEHSLPWTVNPDWTQAFARKGATLIAGTGYQYGHTDFIEYNERLYLEFFRALRSGQVNQPIPIGEALTQAKKVYLAETPNLRGIHVKSLLQSTIFGLPMLSVNMPGPRLAQGQNAPVIPSSGALTSVSGDPGQFFSLKYYDLSRNYVNPGSPDFAGTLSEQSLSLTNVEGGPPVVATYLDGPDGVVSDVGDPTFPLDAVNATVPNSDLVLRGVGFLGGSYRDFAGKLPLVGSATTETSAAHFNFLSSIYYLVRPWSVNRFDALDNENGRTVLNIFPAQYKNETASPSTSTLRQFDTMNLRLFYNNFTAQTGPNQPALAAAPTIVRAGARENGSDVDFLVRVVGDPSAGIQQVWITYTSVAAPSVGGNGGQWQSLFLAQNDPSDSTLWSGTLANVSNAQNLRFIVQAVSGPGLVSLDSNFGRFYAVQGAAAAEPEQTAVLNLNGPSSGNVGSKVTFDAKLVDGDGDPIAGLPLIFGVGPKQVFGLTNANGVATADLLLNGAPGTYALTASFPGSAQYLASSATPRPFTINPQQTTLVLNPASLEVAQGDPVPYLALLEDIEGNPLRQKTVRFVFTPLTALASATAATADLVQKVVITNPQGEAPLGGISLLEGSYEVQAFFDGTGALVASSSTTSTLTVNEASAEVVRLTDSQGNPIEGATAKVYDGSWQTLGTTNSAGEVAYSLAPGSYTFSITYRGATINKVQDIAVSPTVEFQTVLVEVALKDSAGLALEGGLAEFYAGSWQDIGLTGVDGRASTELLPKEYSFAMSYLGGRITKVQNVSTNSLVEFATVAVEVRLQDSSGTALEGGTAEFYAGSWQTITTSPGTGLFTAELLPKEYSFGMTYLGGRITKSQDVSASQTVVFATVPATVRLQTTLGYPLAGGEAEFYAGSWRNIGTTDDSGEVATELLPKSYSFALTYDGNRQQQEATVEAPGTTVVFEVANEQPIVLPGFNEAALIEGLLKFRNFATQATGFDVQLGLVEQGDNADWSEYDSGSSYPYGASNPFTLSYDGSGLQVAHPINNGTGSQILAYPTGDLGSLNYLQIEVYCRHPGQSVSLNNVMLGSYALGDFPATTCDNGIFIWQVVNLDISGGFTLTGDLVLSSFAGLGGQETSKVVIRAGLLDS